MAAGFIAIGSGPAGLSAAETFRSKHPNIPVRIVTTDPALPYAKPPLSKAYLCGREAKLDLHSPGWFVRHHVELQRGITVDHIDTAHQEVVTAGGRHYGVEVGDRVAKILSDNGVRFLGSTAVTDIDNTHVRLDTGALVEGDVIVSATGVRPDPHLAADAGLNTHDGRIVVDEHMHTSAQNVYAAGDVALAYNTTAGRHIRAEHWRDAAQQGRVAGLSAAGHEAVWDKVPQFSCTIGESMLKYCGWGMGYEHSRLVDHHDGFTVYYESAADLVGVLTLNADDDYRRATTSLVAGTSSTVQPRTAR